jgi:hypothetical protein
VQLCCKNPARVFISVTQGAILLQNQASFFHFGHSRCDFAARITLKTQFRCKGQTSFVILVTQGAVLLQGQGESCHFWSLEVNSAASSLVFQFVTQMFYFWSLRVQFATRVPARLVTQGVAVSFLQGFD